MYITWKFKYFRLVLILFLLTSPSAKKEKSYCNHWDQLGIQFGNCKQNYLLLSFNKKLVVATGRRPVDCIMNKGAQLLDSCKLYLISKL